MNKVKTLKKIIEVNNIRYNYKWSIEYNNTILEDLFVEGIVYNNKDVEDNLEIFLSNKDCSLSGFEKISIVIFESDIDFIDFTYNNKKSIIVNVYNEEANSHHLFRLSYLEDK